MKTNFLTYKVEDSASRMTDILTTSDTSYEELDSIPSRDRLTFNNGFYVNCTALFIDIRGSSSLPAKHTRPKLARLYRTYLSECVAVINSDPNCSEVTIVGDCVSGIFNTPYKADIDATFSTSARLSSLVKIMNYKFKKHGVSEIAVGIGIAYGRALMIKAGYSGSGINDVVWMGDVVNEASNLCHHGNSSWNDRQLMVSNLVYSNLNEHNQKLLEKNWGHDCYHGNVINTSMQEWYEKNCQ